MVRISLKTYSFTVKVWLCFIFLNRATGENLAFAQEHKIPFECCLTSNVKCKTVPSYEDHHVAKLLKLKHPVCVCVSSIRD